jgi:hypothetical protein
MSYAIVQRILNRIDDDIAIRSGVIIDGNAQDYAQYRYLCGGVQSLSNMRLEIQGMIGDGDNYKPEETMEDV